MPTCAALMPVDSAISPPIIMAIRMPLPASAVAAPRDVNSPVPTIIAAVNNVAVIFPRARGADLSAGVATKHNPPSHLHFQQSKSHTVGLLRSSNFPAELRVEIYITSM